MRKKLGLALGSGGARGVAHIGFLQALEEADIRADCVTGCSMGAIVGGCYCAGVPVSVMKERAFKLRLSQIATLNVAPICANGLFRLNKARNILTELIGNKEFGDLPIPFRCVATDLHAGETVTLDSGNVVDAVIASSSMPGAFTPFSDGERCLVDGGILERVPTEQLKKMGAEVVVAVDVLGNLMEKEVAGNVIDTLLRCIDIMDTRATLRKKRSRMRSVDLWLEPELGTMSQYRVKQKNLVFAYEKGYELGKANAEKIKLLLGE